MRRLVLALVAAVTAVTATARAQPIPDGFAFEPAPADSAAFLPTFAPRTITDADRITARGDAFFRGDAPVRFFGANLVADAAFPTPGEANRVAAEMRRAGFNLVRFHHLDNPWSAVGLFPRSGGRVTTTRTLDPDALDALDYLVFRLKHEGLYVNMNLHVARTFLEADGVAGADGIADFGKGVTLFDPQLIALQKEYARQLLRHVNPYTGRALADDPVLAMVEITNENSLYHLWRGGGLRAIDDGGVLIPRHAALLDRLWHDHLAARYADDDALRAAWAADAAAPGPEQVANGAFEAPLGGRWVLEQHGGARAAVARDAAAPYAGAASARVDVAALGPDAWNAQWKQVGLSLARDTTYAVSFALRTDAPRPIGVVVQKETEPWTVWAGFTADATTEWRTFRFTFTAPEASDGDTRLSFVVGDATGAVWVDDVSLRVGGREGLEAEESLAAGTVRRLVASEAAAYSTARVRDEMAFYVALQDAYYAEMHAFLTDELGVRAPITGTNWNFGLVDLAVQSALDYVDNHAYWDHPQFPNEPWSPTDWRIHNAPMVRDPAGSTIVRLMGGAPFAGKPYTVSEYNHAFPNRFATEGVLFLAAYGAFHGVDGLMFFDYNGGSWDADRITSHFSLHRHAAMMALMPSAARAFRDGYVAPAERTLEVAYTRDDVLAQPLREDGSWEGTSLVPRTLALTHAVAVRSYDAPAADAALLPAPAASPYVTDTGEIVWDERGLLRVAAPRFEGATGFLDAFADTPIGAATLVDGSGFATLTWVSLTDEPLRDAGRSLLTLASTAQNTGMEWTGTTTVGDRWGRAPVVVQPRRVTLALDVRADSLRLHALAPDGTPGTATTLRPEADGRFRVAIDQQATPTLWFGLERLGSRSTEAEPDPRPAALALTAVYPNPADRTVRVAFALPAAGPAALDVFDLLGRRVAAHRADGAAGTGTVTLDVSALPAGLYHVRLRQGTHAASRPLVVR